MSDKFYLWKDQSVSHASIVPFLVEDGKKHPAILVIPGGGYGEVCEYSEGHHIALSFNKLGYHAFVLDYRVAPNRYPAPQQDAIRAVKFIRGNADKWNVEADKIVSCGFSAGGHLAGSIGVLYEKIEALDRTNALGSYNGKKGIIKLRPDLDLDGLVDEMEKSFTDDPRAYATKSRRHALRHEIGHAIMQAVKNKRFNTTGRLSELETQWEEREEKLKKLCREVLENPALASTRAMQDQFELVAEAFAVALLDDFERKVIFKGRGKELAVKDAFAAKVMLTLIGAL